MQLLLFQSLAIIVAVALAVLTSALWRKSLRAPWLFLVIGILAMLGLERLLGTLWDYVPIAFGSHQFLVHRPLTAEEITNPSLSLESIAVAVMVLVIGLPLLVWLRGTTGGKRGHAP